MTSRVRLVPFRWRITLLSGFAFGLAGSAAFGIHTLVVDQALRDAIPTSMPSELAPVGGVLLPNGQTVTEYFLTNQQHAAELVTTDSRAVAAISVLLATLLAMLIAFYVATRAMRPVLDVSEAARRASRFDLSERVAMPTGRDELSELVETFNVMLSRLESGMATREAFVSYANHELRGPLTRALILAEISQSNKPTDAALAELSNAIRSMVEQQRRALDGLVLLASSDYALTTSTVNVQDVVMRVVRQLHPDADHAHVALEVDIAPLIIETNRDLLEILLTNIVKNAIHHNRLNGIVTVFGRLLPASQLVIENTGPIQPPSSDSKSGRGEDIVAATAAILGYSITTSSRADYGRRVCIEFARGRTL